MEWFLLDVRLALPGYDSASGRFQISRGTLTRSDPGDIMAQAAQMNVIEINSPIRVEHDRKRRQFSIRLNGTVTFIIMAKPRRSAAFTARATAMLSFVFIKSLSIRVIQASCFAS